MSSIFPEKFPVVPIPGEISRFPEQFWLCHEAAFNILELSSPVRLIN